MTYLDTEDIEALVEEDDYDDEGLLYEEDDYDDEELLYEEDDYDDEGLLYEEDDYDDEGLGESLAERRRKKRKYGYRYGRRYYSRPSYRRPRTASGRGLGNIRGTRAGRVFTSKGTARMSLPQSVATKAEVKKALAKVGRQIRINSKAIKANQANISKLDKYHRSRTGALEKDLSRQGRSAGRKFKAVEKKVKQVQDQAQQQALLPLLLSLSPPKLESFKATGNTTGIEETYQVSETNYKTSSSMLLMLPLMMMGGSFGSSNSMLTLALMLPLIFKDGNGESDSSETMMMMMMMMMMSQGQKKD